MYVRDTLTLSSGFNSMKAAARMEWIEVLLPVSQSDGCPCLDERKRVCAGTGHPTAARAIDRPGASSDKRFSLPWTVLLSCRHQSAMFANGSSMPGNKSRPLVADLP